MKYLLTFFNNHASVNKHIFCNNSIYICYLCIINWKSVLLPPAQRISSGNVSMAFPNRKQSWVYSRRFLLGEPWIYLEGEESFFYSINCLLISFLSSGHFQVVPQVVPVYLFQSFISFKVCLISWSLCFQECLQFSLSIELGEVWGFKNSQRVKNSA